MPATPLFEELWVQLKASLPPEAEQFKEDLEKHAKMAILRYFRQLDLVTREEFDVQKAVLKKTIARMKLLEKQIEERL
jgi:BMFP domain-containing protein YqiC